MMKPLVSTIVLAAVVALPLSAFAADEAPKSKPTAGTFSGGEGPRNSPGGKPAYTGDDHLTFKAFDTNNDGFVSADEAKKNAELTRRFKNLDKNGDGKLSPDEFAAWGGRAKPTAGTFSGGEGPMNSPGGKPAYQGGGKLTDRPTAGADSGGEGPTSIKK
jgi:hypothetical protein